MRQGKDKINTENEYIGFPLFHKLVVAYVMCIHWVYCLVNSWREDNDDSCWWLERREAQRLQKSSHEFSSFCLARKIDWIMGRNIDKVNLFK